MIFSDRKYFYIIIFLIPISLIDLSGQDTTWIDLKVQPKEFRPKHDQSSYPIKGNIKFQYPITIDDVVITYFELDYLSSSKLYFLRGKKDGLDVIITDLDNDGSFLNDIIYTLPFPTLAEEVPRDEKYVYPTDYSFMIPVNYKTICNGDTIDKLKMLSITSYIKYNSKLNELYHTNNVYIGFASNLLSKVALNNTSINIQFSDVVVWMDIPEISVSINREPIKKIRLRGDYYLNGYRYQIDSFNFCEERLRVIIDTTRKELIVRGPNLKNDTILSSKELKANYKIIHVWGTWCKPCLESFPKLFEIYNKYHEIDFLGICVDESANLVRRHTIFNQIKWLNIFYEFKEFQHVKNNLIVVQYPTYFLVDKDDLLIDRYNSVEELQVAIDDLRIK